MNVTLRCVCTLCSERPREDLPNLMQIATRPVSLQTRVWHELHTDRAFSESDLQFKNTLFVFKEYSPPKWMEILKVWRPPRIFFFFGGYEKLCKHWIKILTRVSLGLLPSTDLIKKILNKSFPICSWYVIVMHWKGSARSR